MAERRSKKVSASPAAATRRWWVIGACVAAVAGIVWLVAGRGPDFAGEAVALQQRLLREDVSPRERQVVLTTLMRHVDKLDAEAQRSLRDAVRAEWRDLQRLDMDAYFEAAEGDRQKALDGALDRLQLIAELDEAFTPGGMRVRQQRPSGDDPRNGGRRDRPPRSGERDPAAQDRRKAIEAYATALEKRARERGVEFSSLRRRLLRG